MESVFNLLETHFNYKPKITINEFFSANSHNNSDKMIIFAIDLITAIKNKHATLSKRSTSLKDSSSNRHLK